LKPKGTAEMSPNGTKRTSWSRRSMSALWGKAEMTWKLRHFRFWPIASILRCPLFRRFWWLSGHESIYEYTAQRLVESTGDFGKSLAVRRWMVTRFDQPCSSCPCVCCLSSTRLCRNCRTRSSCTSVPHRLMIQCGSFRAAPKPRHPLAFAREDAYVAEDLQRPQSDNGRYAYGCA
jgi:hypothetical protein